MHEMVSDSVEAAARGDPPYTGKSLGLPPEGDVAAFVGDDDETPSYDDV